MYVNLIDICNPKQWKTVALKNLVADGKYYVYGANGIVGKYNVYNHENETILIGCRGTCGIINISKPKSYINGNAMCLDDLDEELFRKKYIYYYLKNYDFSDIISGSAVPQITIQGLKKIKIKKIPLEEQDKIIESLEKIDKLITLKKEGITKYNKLIESEFNEMFGDPIINEKNWKTDVLKNLGDFKNGMNFNKSESGYEIKFLGVGDFSDRKIIDDVDSLDVVNLNTKPSEEYLLKNNDIIFVRSNGSKDLVGRSVLISDINEALTYSGFCIRFRNTSNDINARYLIELFHDNIFFNYLKKDNRGANINNINQQMLSNLKIIIPHIDLQNKFAIIVEKVNKQKSEFEESLNKLKELQSSLMQEYFG